MRAILLLLLLSLAYAQYKLNFISQHQPGSIEEIVKKFSDNQNEIHRKVFTHYIQELISEYRQSGIH
jgi:hypothetical protein